MGTSFIRFVRNHTFDRQTDRRTALSWLDRVACNACSAVIMFCETTRRSLDVRLSPDQFAMYMYTSRWFVCSNISDTHERQCIN